MARKSLAAEYAEKIAVPPCVPSCRREDWHDLPAEAGTIATICRKCRRWIGNRPASGKHNKHRNAEAAEGTEKMTNDEIRMTNDRLTSDL